MANGLPTLALRARWTRMVRGGEIFIVAGVTWVAAVIGAYVIVTFTTLSDWERGDKLSLGEISLGIAGLGGAAMALSQWAYNRRRPRLEFVFDHTLQFEAKDEYDLENGGLTSQTSIQVYNDGSRPTRLSLVDINLPASLRMVDCEAEYGMATLKPQGAVVRLKDNVIAPNTYKRLCTMTVSVRDVDLHAIPEGRAGTHRIYTPDFPVRVRFFTDQGSEDHHLSLNSLIVVE